MEKQRQHFPLILNIVLKLAHQMKNLERRYAQTPYRVQFFEHTYLDLTNF